MGPGFSGPRERGFDMGGRWGGKLRKLSKLLVKAKEKEFLVITSKLGQESSCEILYYII